MLWNPTASGKPTTYKRDVYYSSSNNASPWTTGAATSPTYTHHAAVMKLANAGSTGGYRLYSSFSTHPLAEDVRGQWVSYSYSDDNGMNWSARGDLFTCPDTYNYESYEATGYRLQNCGFFECDSKTYALCQCNVAPRAFPSVAAYFVREVTIGGLGTVYRLGSWGATEFPSVSEHADSAAMITVVRQPENRPYMLTGALAFPYPMAMNEPASVLLGNGDVLRFWRAGWLDITHFWRSVVSGGVEVFDGPATSVPNDPSASAMLRLSNGKIAWCGNFDANKSRKVLQLATSNDDGAGWQKIYEVWTQSSLNTWWVDTSKGAQMTGGGFAYPAMVENDGKLIIICSALKQIMQCLIIPVSSL